MKAIIMAGGEGTRLRPLTCDMPKPMVRVMNKPVLEHILNLLRRHGIYDVAITLGYLPERIVEYFDDGSKWGMNITYFTEITPLGTAGGVKAAQSFIDGDFLVISGDALCDIDLSEAIKFHREKEADATIVLSRVKEPKEYGVVICDGDGAVTRFAEKPSWSEAVCDTVNSGIYIFKKEILDFIPDGKSDFAQGVFPRIMGKRNLCGYLARGYWCDIGDIGAYRKCHYDALERRVNLELGASEVMRGIFLESGAVIERGAVVSPPLYLGRNAKILRGAVVSGGAVIGSDSVIEHGASIKRSIIGEDVTVHAGAQLRGCVIDSKSEIFECANIYEQSVIGRECKIGAHATIKPTVKIWCKKEIADCSTVNENVVWGRLPKEPLIRDGRVERSTSDFTPDFAARLGEAAGTLLSGRVAVSGDGARADMLKRAFSSGLQSSGCEVLDMGDAPCGVVRCGCDKLALSGGGVFAENDGRITLTLFCSRGETPPRRTEKEFEGIFSRRDFKRAANPIPIRGYEDFSFEYVKDKINLSPSSWQDEVFAACESEKIRAIASAIAKNSQPNLKVVYELPQDCEIGFAIEACGEELRVVCDGKVLDAGEYAALCALITLKKFGARAKIYAGVSRSYAIERLAEEFGAQVCRTKESKGALLRAIDEDATAAARFQRTLYFDAIGAMCEIMNYVTVSKLSLGELISRIPPIFIREKELHCPDEKKGGLLSAVSHERGADMTDGVKLTRDRGWVLILPDNYRPFCRIIAEGTSEETASELCAEYEKLLGEKLREE